MCKFWLGMVSSMPGEVWANVLSLVHAARGSVLFAVVTSAPKQCLA